MEVTGSVDLYWIPLGAGAHVARLSGRGYEALCAFVKQRPRHDRYHSALIVNLPEGRFVIEQAPVRDAFGAARGVVAVGPVGTRLAGRLRLFRYEVRCWKEGTIPDHDAAVSSPQRVCDDSDLARELLRVVSQVPTPVWGRDEFGAGEMWNSNSVIAWVLTRTGIPLGRIPLLEGGRAPGFDAGVVVASGDQSARIGLTARVGAHFVSDE